MNGKAFREWREGAGLTQTEVATRASVSLRTVIRAEGKANSSVPAKVAAVASGQPELLPDTIKTPKGALGAVKAKAATVVPRALREAMLRNPPYATTAAEAKAMRHLRAEQKGVYVSTIRLLPLRPVWRRLESGRQVNAAIPDPLDVAPPAWAGPRGVVTRTGAVYDYEAAHQIREPASRRSAQPVAGNW